MKITPHQKTNAPYDKRSTLVALACGVFCLMGTDAKAANLTTQATLEQVGSFDTNPMMIAKGAKTLWGSTTSPELLIGSKTPTSTLNLQLSVNEGIFSDPAYNTTDIHTTVNLSKNNQRWGLGFAQKTDYDTTRTSEITTYGLNIGQVRHLGLSLEPNLSFSPSAVTKLSMTGNFLAARYESDSYTDYNVFSVTPMWTHTLDSLNSVFVDTSIQRYQTVDTGYKNDSLGPTIGWNSQLTERLSLRAQGGAQVSQATYRYFGKQKAKWSNIYSASLAYQGTQDTLNLSAVRSQQPYGNGTESLLTTFSLSNTHYLTPLFSLNFAVSYKMADQTQSAGSSLDSQYNGNMGLSYRLTDGCDISGSYRYARENLTNSTSNPEGSLGRIGLTLHPQALVTP